MKTYSAKPSDVKREWLVIDATDIPLGRLASFVATRLTGKHKAMFTSHIDTGDHVIIINSDKVGVTGNNKMIDKKYYRHSGYPGNLKTTTLKDKIEGDSTEVVKLAVYGMLPKNKLHSARMERLRIYKDENHNHEAQKPQKVSIK